jgi:serine/threonine protein kinase
LRVQARGSPDGFVKIFDFGLSKLAAAESGEVSAMPTVAKPETQPGTVLGTVAYMSPEQASGQAVDYRSDQFSLGSILHEALTGEKAFAHNTPAETMAAIIRDEPRPISQLRPETPPPLKWIVERGLARPKTSSPSFHRLSFRPDRQRALRSGRADRDLRSHAARRRKHGALSGSAREPGIRSSPGRRSPLSTLSPAGPRDF